MDIPNDEHCVGQWLNADHGRDLHPLADHMTELNKISPRNKIMIFQHLDFHFS